MNNPKSTALGWASLVAAAGVSYYFAKKGIDERRREQDAAGTRPTEKLDWRARIEKEEKQAGANASFQQAKEDTRSDHPTPNIKTASPGDEVPSNSKTKPSNTRPPRKKENVVRKDEDAFLDWAPGVPPDMLSIFQVELQESHTPRKNRNFSSSPIETFQHSFLLNATPEPEERQDQPGSPADSIALNPSTSTNSTFSGFSDNPSLYMAQSISKAASNLSSHVSGFPPGISQALQPSHHRAPPLGLSTSLPVTRCPSPGPYTMEYQFPVAHDPSHTAVFSLPSVFGPSPFAQPPPGTQHFGHINPHDVQSHHPQTEHFPSMDQDPAQMNFRQFHRYDAPSYPQSQSQPKALHPHGTIYTPSETYQASFGITSDGRRHSLPSIPHIPTPPPLHRPQHTLIGPSQTSYYAPLIPSRLPPRLPDIPMQGDLTRRPPPITMPTPWQPSLAQFPGPLRLGHPGFPMGPAPNLAGYTDTHAVHTPGTSSVSSLASGSLPPSVASSPLPLEPISETAGPSAPRPTMARAESWTAHFESLPTVKFKAKRSRPQRVEKENTRVRGRKQYAYPSPYPGYVLLHQCPLCPRAFERRNGLAIHLKWHYKPEEPQTTSQSPFTTSVAPSTSLPVDPNSSPSMSMELIQPPGSSPNILLPQRTSGHLTPSNAVDNGPITPLATPPPSPSVAKDAGADSFLDCYRSSNHQRSHSRIWPELFGSDD
ncbi:hypothetical protein EIP86_006847 [Pleurotus ostreatoroseus]|nr:hypothetical protein EIP86_006847 [Pleurotus ostreatoroseus]